MKHAGIIIAQQVHLASRPQGLPVLENFALVEVPLAAPEDGEILVRNRWMALDPHLRLRMERSHGSLLPFELGRVMEGSAIGEVLVSCSPRFRAGDLVCSMFGWRDFYVAQASQVAPIDTAADPDLPLELRLGALGLSGLAAFAALFRIAELQAGERVLISGATGALGSAACAFAKAHGCQVVATAGGEERRAWLEQELGVVALDYRASDFDAQVAAACPHGVDVYLDTVGGDQLRVALEHMNDFGCIVSCGMMDQYNDRQPCPRAANLQQVASRRLRIEGFNVRDHMDLAPDFWRAATELLRDGVLKWRHTVLQGLRAAPQGFIDVSQGRTFGKCLVHFD